MIIEFLIKHTFYLLIPSRVLNKKSCYCTEDILILIMYVLRNKKKENIAAKERGKRKRKKINRLDHCYSQLLYYTSRVGMCALSIKEECKPLPSSYTRI